MHTFSPALVNEFIVTGTRDNQVRGTFDPNVKFASEMGLPNPFQATNFPNVTSLGLGNYALGRRNLLT